MIYRLNSLLSFGKHKGETIKTVIANDPTYLDWAIGEIQGFELDGDAEEALDKALDELESDLFDYPVWGEFWGDRE